MVRVQVGADWAVKRITDGSCREWTAGSDVADTKLSGASVPGTVQDLVSGCE